MIDARPFFYEARGDARSERHRTFDDVLRRVGSVERNDEEHAFGRLGAVLANMRNASASPRSNVEVLQRIATHVGADPREVVFAACRAGDTPTVGPRSLSFERHADDVGETR